MRVNCNRLIGFARSVLKDNPVQIADYLAKMIKRNFRVDYIAQAIYSDPATTGLLRTKKQKC